MSTYYVSSGVVSSGLSLGYSVFHWSDDYMNVLNGGTALQTTVNNGGTINVSRGGLASDTIVSSGGIFNVSSGGVASDTTLLANGSMYVLSKGTATDTEIRSSGRMWVSSTGVASSTFLSSGGTMTVSKGGSGLDTMVNKGATLIVSSGASATIQYNPWSGTVSSAAGAKVTRLDRTYSVYFGGTNSGLVSRGNEMTNLAVNSGLSALVYSDGVVGKTTVNSGGRLHVSGGVANETTVNTNGIMYVSGGTANETAVNGSMSVLGGAANETTVNASGRLSVSGGVASSTIVNGSMSVLDGGSANETTVNESGTMSVSGGVASSTIVNGSMSVLGGTANGTTVNGNMSVSNGTANGTTVNGSMSVLSGGVASSTVVNTNGRMSVLSGGAANEVTVDSYGRLEVAGKGSTTAIRENGGFVAVEDGAETTFAVNSFSGLVLSAGQSATVHYGTTANATEVNADGGLFVYDNGNANETVVNAGGLLSVNGGYATSTTVNGSMSVVNGGNVNETIVNAGGEFTLTGVADETVVNADGVMSVLDGGYAGSTVVNGSMSVSNGVASSTSVNGSMSVLDGGVANEVTVNSSGRLDVSGKGSATVIKENGGFVAVEDGANVTFAENSFSGLVLSAGQSATAHSGTTANATEVNADGGLFVYDGGVANATEVNADGTLAVSGGAASSTIVNGSMSVSDGGTANETVVSSGGELSLSGGVANDTTVDTNGSLFVYDGGVANGNAVNSYGSMFIYDGGAASETVLDAYGSMFIYDGGFANDIMVNSYGNLEICDGGVVTGTAVNTYGSVTVSAGGVANDTTVNAGGLFSVSQNAVANGITVNDGGLFIASKDAAANDITVNDGGEVSVTDGGVVTGITVNAGGTLSVSQNAEIGGKMLIEDGASLIMEDGSSFDFTLAGTDPGFGCFVNDLSMIEGNPSYTITIESHQATGTYELAGGAEGFSETITIRNDVRNLGEIAVDETFYIGKRSYQLTLDNDTLALTVTFYPDPAPIVTPDIVAPTSGSVTLTAEYAEDAVLKEYRVNDGDWMEYSVSVVCSENCTVYFRSLDDEGSYSLVSEYSVTNIDKDAPEKPAARANTVSPTTDDVTVIAIFSRDTEVGEYSLDGAEWHTYAEGVVMTDNGSVFFRGKDAAGNVSGVTEYQVTNIDRIPPEKPVASETAVEGGVIVSAVFSEDTAKAQYSLDNVKWQDYTAGLAFRDNGTVYFRGIDAVGNISEVTEYDVDSIVLPEDTYTISGAGAGSGSVELDHSGKYTLSGDFGDITGTATLLNGGKTVGTGTIKNGVLTFNKGKSVLLDSSKETELRVTVKGGSEVYYTAVLEPEAVFDRGDKGANDWTDLKTAGADSGNVDAIGVVNGDSDVLVPDSGLSGWVGYGDAKDYMSFTLEDAASLSLDLTSTDAAKFTIHSLTSAAKNGITTYSLKNMQSVSLAAPKSGNPAEATTKNLLLAAGTYYIGVESTTAAKGASAAYSISLNDEKSVFFVRGDNSDDWTDLKTAGADSENVGAIGVVSKSSDMLVPDDGVFGWVGFGDAKDYMSFTLENAASISLDLTSTDASKFAVYSLVATTKKDVTTYSLKSLQSASLAASKNGNPTEATTKNLLLTAGTYYIGVESTNAAKGGSSAYTISLNDEKSVFFVRGDNSDDWTNMKTVGAGEGAELDRLGSITAPGTVIESDWVGYGDTVDYKEFTLNDAARVSFGMTAADASKFTIYELTPVKDKSGNITSYKLTSRQSTALTKPKGAEEYSANTKDLLLTAGTYYIAVNSTNAAKGGSADYSVVLNDSSEFFVRGDKGANDWADLKTAGADSENIDAIGVVSSASDVLVPDSGLSGWVGYGDAKDYMSFTLEDAASLSLGLTATGASKFTIYSLVATTKKDVTTYSLKSLQTTSLAAPKGEYPTEATTKDLLLTAGTYYIGVESTTAAKGGSAAYTISLDEGSGFFVRGDKGANDWADLKTAGAASENVDAIGVVSSASDVLVPDSGLSGWVGFGDAKDYMSFTLEDAASLSLELTATDVSKFTIYSLVATTEKDVTTYSLKSLQTASLAAQKGEFPTEATTKNLLLTAGTYYIGVESTNAAKGGSSSYTISLDDNSEFYTEGNSADDSWQAGGLPAIAAGDEQSDWVGFGDAVDYRTVTVDPNGGFYNFALSGAENNVKLTVYSVNEATNKLTAVKSITATAKNPSLSTGDLCLNGSTQYVVAVEAVGAAKAQNSHYTIAMSASGTFANSGNESWDTATELDSNVEGLLTTAAGGDRFDYYDLAGVDSLNIDMNSGKAVVSFYDEQKKLVRTNVDYANGKSANLASLTLVTDNASTDNIALGALDESIRYMRIEGGTAGINRYQITLSA